MQIYTFMTADYLLSVGDFSQMALFVCPSTKATSFVHIATSLTILGSLERRNSRPHL
jgi:hypothetical protein